MKEFLTKPFLGQLKSAPVLFGWEFTGDKVISNSSLNSSVDNVLDVNLTNIFNVGIPDYCFFRRELNTNKDIKTNTNLNLTSVGLMLLNIHGVEGKFNIIDTYLVVPIFILSVCPNIGLIPILLIFLLSVLFN